MGGRLDCQMLTAAETDLQPDPLRALRKQAHWVERTALWHEHLQLRQQLLKQPPAPRTQSMALAAAVDEALQRVRPRPG
jgi:hypothetical protein